MPRSTTRTLSARDIMNPRVHALHTDALISSATRWLIRKGYSEAPVLQKEGKLVGVLSEQNCLKAQLEMFMGSPQGTVGSYMSSDLRTVGCEEDLTALIEPFKDPECRHLLVLDDNGQLCGLISRRDMLKALDERLERTELPSTYDLLHQRWR